MDLIKLYEEDKMGMEKGKETDSLGIKKFVENLSKDLKIEYPNSTGYTVRNLNYMKQFAMRISNEEILHPSGAKLK